VYVRAYPLPPSTRGPLWGCVGGARSAIPTPRVKSTPPQPQLIVVKFVPTCLFSFRWGTPETHCSRTGPGQAKPQSWGVPETKVYVNMFALLLLGFHVVPLPPLDFLSSFFVCLLLSFVVVRPCPWLGACQRRALIRGRGGVGGSCLKSVGSFCLPCFLLFPCVCLCLFLLAFVVLCLFCVVLWFLFPCISFRLFLFCSLAFGCVCFCSVRGPGGSFCPLVARGRWG